MIVRFDSKVGGFTMMGDVAVTLLRMMGHSGTVPSAILAADIPAAVARLRAALAALPPPAAEPDTDGDDEDDRRRDAVPLPHRAVPLIDLLERSAAANVDVTWTRDTGLVR
jgi:hypothetical protein